LISVRISSTLGGLWEDRIYVEKSMKNWSRGKEPVLLEQYVLEDIGRLTHVSRSHRRPNWLTRTQLEVTSSRAGIEVRVNKFDENSRFPVMMAIFSRDLKEERYVMEHC